MMTLPQKILSIRIAAGMTQSEFGEAIGVTQGQVSKWERKINPEQPSIEYLRAIAKFAKLGLDQLTDAPGAAQLVPVIGRVFHGGQMGLYNKDINNQAAIPSPDGATAATVALHIEDDALGPAFAGWHVFYDDIKLPPGPDSLGKLCVVEMADGRVLIRTITPGHLPERYTLIPVVGPPSYDQEVSWVSPIKHISQG